MRRRARRRGTRRAAGPGIFREPNSTYPSSAWAYPQASCLCPDNNLFRAASASPP
ncbi:hypothetical protein KXW38_001131, partial [Aspergillus fumigatus]